MSRPNPTLWQRSIANDWLVNAWMILGAGATAATISIVARLDRLALSGVWELASSVLIIGLGLLLGLLLAGVVGVFIFGPLSMEQGLRNGGPFRVGDTVLVLSGKHRNQVSVIYALWRGDALRVDLGEEEKGDFKDIFGSHQLLRVHETNTSIG